MRFFPLLGLVFFASLAQAVAMDRQDVRHPKVDYVVIEVNGEPVFIRDQEEAVLVKGDVLRIKKAALVKSHVSPNILNLLGYKGASQRHSQGEKGVTIDTSKDLMESWSIDKKGERYELQVGNGSKIYGSVYIRLIEPILRYAELDLDGQTLVLRDGELARMAGDVKVKVKKVVTNIGNESKVKFQVVPVTTSAELGRYKLFELRFVRNQLVFSRIPLLVEGNN